jgi:hypothetical protein
VMLMDVFLVMGIIYFAVEIADTVKFWMRD